MIFPRLSIVTIVNGTLSRRHAECEVLHGAEERVRFLPFTSKSALPKWPWLVQLYLRLRPAQWLFGKQTFVVARKRS